MVKTALPLQKAKVQSMVREQRSHMPHSTVRKENSKINPLPLEPPPTPLPLIGPGKSWPLNPRWLLIPSQTWFSDTSLPHSRRCSQNWHCYDVLPTLSTPLSSFSSAHPWMQLNLRFCFGSLLFSAGWSSSLLCLQLSSILCQFRFSKKHSPRCDKMCKWTIGVNIGKGYRGGSRNRLENI